MRRRVHSLDEGITYTSLTQAAEMTGCSKSHISAVCNGQLKTAKGLRFSFADPVPQIKKETKVKRRYTHHGVYWSKKERYKEVTWVNQQPIYCWTNGETYKSVSEAARETGISRSTILRNCKINKDAEDEEDLKETVTGWSFTFESNDEWE